jgi:hypothetical protein
MKFNFIKPTLIFTIVGLLIPGFTAIGLLGFQMLLSKIGIECSTAWTVIWTTTTIAGLFLPYLFYRDIAINPTGFYRKRSSSILNILVLEIFPYSFCIVG